MTNKKTLALAALIALFVSIIGGFVVYAAITQQLDIQGSASFVPQSWKVNFKAGTLSVSPTLAGGATVITPPTLTNTVISNFEVVLRREGSAVTYTFDIENTGLLDALLTEYDLGVPICTGTAPTAVVDEGIVCSSNLTYTLKYLANTHNVTNGIIAGNDVAMNDKLNHGTTASLELKIEFSSGATVLPTNAVAISGLNSYLIYTAQ